jgi:hypothetical protein
VLSPATAKSILGRTKSGRWVRSPERFLNYFEEAYLLLKRKNGWCQGAYARSKRGKNLYSAKDKRAHSYCAVGALEAVTPEFKDYSLAARLLSAALGGAPDVNAILARQRVIEENDSKKAEVAEPKILGAYLNVMDALKALCDS